MSHNCSKYGKIKNVSKTIGDIEQLCKSLRANKVKATQELFSKLPLTVQCLFLYHASKILEDTNASDDSYLTAFYLFKLFRSKEMKESKVYSGYKTDRIEKVYKMAVEWNRENKGTTTSRTKKKFSKKYQKFDEPKDNLDPLYVFYNSLYEEKPKSRLAITWLTEHGVYEGKQREKIEEQYKKLVDSNKLIK